ncbi:threonylcarbamoyladenosine tRNA methylthiotransferase [archaeon CG10_big_fil_rev_8_21_14_0_10_43_11]|nr:MAG: threonylcarbamoyladenosine tRNA methylthiotransferase [archaeon CG10_big_fil_rev_8_21_14_0_10_43_11]
MKVAFVTYGCSVNQADSGLMQQQLKKSGHTIVLHEKDADVVVVNTCVVKSPTERKIVKKLETLRNKQVVVAGCMAQSQPEFVREHFPEYAILGVEGVDAISDIIDGNVKENTQLKRLNKAGMGVVHKDSCISIVEVNEGCLSNCSYCMTKKARGNLYSYPIRDIVRNVKNAHGEVWLTSQDMGCYGFDSNTNLANLLNQINALGKRVWVRVGMMSPQHAARIQKPLITSFASDKVFKFLHIPVQSGSNAVLAHMRRGYEINTFERVVNAFKKAYPKLTLATDIIAGYPTETDRDFEKTRELLTRVRPSVTNISMYWERPKTSAAMLKQLPNYIRKERTRELTKICAEITEEEHKKWIGWQGRVYIDEVGKHDSLVGRNFAYKPIVLKQGVLGSFVNARVTDAKAHHLVGEIV